jgi:hypothetical protein
MNTDSGSDVYLDGDRDRIDPDTFGALNVSQHNIDFYLVVVSNILSLP